MNTLLQQILVFKTNISSPEAAESIGQVFNNRPDIISWSIDQQDIDLVLRVVSPSLEPKDVIAIVNKEGYACGELDS